MPSNDCPSEAELTAFNLGDLPADALDAVTAHVETCPHCEQVLRRLDRLSDEMISSLRHLSGVAAQPSPALELPSQIGVYEILGELGRGGMGVVFKARHHELQRLVALKMLLSGEFAQEDVRARFRSEAATVARLQHPNIIQIIDIGEWRGNAGGPPIPYFTLEYVEGGSLSSRLAGKPQPARPAATWLLTLARAVHYAHAQGIVHRDLKPSNVLLTADGLLKLCDFGVARRLTGSDLKTRSGLLVGTPEYMAPEQARGQAAGPAADVYALGAMLYTMLTGRPPLQGASVLDTLDQVGSQEPVPPRRLQPAVPRDLETICLKCLSKEPLRRYASAEALADDLERFLNGQTIRARPVGMAERSWKWARRRPTLAALLVLSFLVLGPGFFGVSWLWLRAARERDEKENALYASTLQLAADHLFQGNDVEGARKRLDHYAEAPRAHLRGWEWYYLNRLCHPEAALCQRLTHAPKRWNWVHALAYSPDGKRLASAAGLPVGWAPPYPPDACRTEPGEVKVWDTATGKCLHTFADRPDAAWSVAFSPDGQQIAAGGAAGGVRLWDATTYREVPGSPVDVPGGVYYLKYARHSRLLAISSTQRIGVWDINRGAWQWHRARHGLGKSALALSHDDRYLVAGNVKDEAPRAWDVRTGQEIPQHLPSGEIQEIAFSPEGKFLALAPRNPSAELWEADANRLLNHLGGHTSNVLSVAFGPDPLAVSGGEGPTALLASAGEDRTVRLCRIHGPGYSIELAVYRGHLGGVRCLAFRSDGKQLASGGEDGSVRIWDTTRDPRGVGFRFSGSPYGSLGEWLGNLAFAADGKRLLLVGELTKKEADGFHVWSRDVTTGRVLSDPPLELLEPVLDVPHRDLVFSADGRRLAGLDRKDPRAIQLWDTQTGKRIAMVATRLAQATALALSADGQRIAYAGWQDGREAKGGQPEAELIVVDATSGQELSRITVARGPLSSLAFSADGRRLAATLPIGGSGPKSAQEVVVAVYDSISGRELQRLRGENQAENGEPAFIPDDHQPLTLVFSRDGGRLALAAPSNSLRVWDTTTGRESIFSPLRPPSSLTGVTFSPDGRRLASTGYDGQVRLWDAIDGHELLTLRGIAAPGGGHYTFSARVVFSPDGRYLVANDWDGTVFVWDSGPRQ